MTEAVVRLSGAASRCRRLAALLGGSLHRAVMADETRRALSELPDDLLGDIGLNRGEIPFVANALASGVESATRDALDRLNRSTANRSATERLLQQAALRLVLLMAIAVSAFVMSSNNVLARDAQIKRGKYLVALGGCNDCHTPGYFFGKPDMARFLGGSEVGFEIPNLGVFHGPNLTPDQETGLGKWSSADIVTAITTGQRPDGRLLAPIMPWHAFANLTGEDVRAIVAFLKSLPPIKNKVPGLFGPREKPISFVMKIVPPEAATTSESPPK
jgi:mono/diheme cytochrome c family protein/uncharacterized protein YjiS (DUF1127 family)